ncbi:MAG: hypothetical protein KF745_00955 [Phycisphaeraceae bacterium]|nr:hypothetical protein [Phycisphaeraceae bacterium]
MQTSNRKNLIAGLGGGIALAALAGVLFGQGASQPVRSDPQYFVTADGEGAHLWVREGTTLRVIGHGECKECTAKGHGDHDHGDGDGHDHGKPGHK